MVNQCFALGLWNDRVEIGTNLARTMPLKNNFVHLIISNNQHNSEVF